MLTGNDDNFYTEQVDEISKVEEAALKYLPKMTPEEYIEWDEQQEGRHEYVDGEIMPLEAVSVNHSRIVVNVVGKIHSYLEGKTCEVFASDVRVSEKTMESYFFPDASIFCSEPDKKENRGDTFKNPSVIFEVLSPSNVNYDLGRKLFFYMQIDSLKEYIAIDSRKVQVHIRRRKENNTWSYEMIDDLNKLVLIETIGLPLNLVDIYPKELTSSSTFSSTP